MIAEKNSRGKGAATEALQIMMFYATSKLTVDAFVAKIGADNLQSIALFKKLGFKEIKYNKIFNEVNATFH